MVWFVQRAALLAAVLVADGLLGVQLARASDEERRAVSAERLESREAASERRRLVVLADPQSGRLIRSVRRDRRQTASAVLADRKISVVEGADPAPKAGSVDLDLLVRQVAARYDVDPELIDVVIRLESAYNPFAVSQKGAKGLMQLMPETARRFGVKDVFDPAENVRGGVEYLRHLLDKYDGDERLTLAAFNAGEGAVERYHGVPPYSETRRYVEGAIRRLRSAEDGISNEDSGDPASGRIVAQLADGALRFEVRRE